MSESPGTLEALLEGLLRRIVRQEMEAFFNRNGKPAGEAKNGSKEYFTVKEAADFARIGPSTIRFYVRKRQLKAQRIGRRVVVKREDLEKFLEANPIEAKER
jgi:excisionase family DNA binding protein